MAVERHPLSIPGHPSGDGSFAPVVSAYTGAPVAEVEQADAAAIDHVLARQRALFADRDGWLPTPERVGVLHRAAGLLARRRDTFADTIATEGGKPLADALVEVDRAATGLVLAAEEAGRLAGVEVPMRATDAARGRLAFTTREPIGVVAAVSAFNHPLNLVVHQVAPAVAAGCPVVVKPASATPLSCLALVELLVEAGLPPGWAVALPCPGAVAQELVTDARIAFLSFIGSHAVGWRMRSQLAPGVRCALEHGGAAPMIVDEGADLDLATQLIRKGGYYHAGQVCVSVQRVFAVGGVTAELVARLEEAVASLRVGDPLDPATEVGPLIAPAEVERVGAWVDEAAALGARPAVGGAAVSERVFAPTLLVDAPAEARVLREEVFGPVVSVVGCADLDDAIARSNAVPWAFQAAVVTRDIDRALRAARRLDATAVMVNDHTAFRVDWMPFGGRGPSGLGLGGIPYSVEEMTRPKLIVLASPE
ncbi:MAG: aldehyde dehydrogenase family protein [Egibacteraceae bacterium]